MPVLGAAGRHSTCCCPRATAGELGDRPRYRDRTGYSPLTGVGVRSSGEGGGATRGCNAGDGARARARARPSCDGAVGCSGPSASCTAGCRRRGRTGDARRAARTLGDVAQSTLTLALTLTLTLTLKPKP